MKNIFKLLTRSFKKNMQVIGYCKKHRANLPVRSPSITRETSAKCLRPVDAMLVATGRMSPMWVHNKAMYFFNKEPTPRSSGSAANKIFFKMLLAWSSNQTSSDLSTVTYCIRWRAPCRTHPGTACWRAASGSAGADPERQNAPCWHALLLNSWRCAERRLSVLLWSVRRCSCSIQTWTFVRGR